MHLDPHNRLNQYISLICNYQLLELPSNSAFTCPSSSECFYAQLDKTTLSLFALNPESLHVQRQGSFEVPARTAPPMSLFVGGRNFLTQHADLYTHLFVEGRVLWASEQSLSDVRGVLWEELGQEYLGKDPYFEALEKHGAGNSLYVLPHLLIRLQQDFQSFIAYASKFPESSVRMLQQLQSSKGELATESKEYDIIYGLRQRVVLVTSIHTVLCMDSEGGVLLWKE